MRHRHRRFGPGPYLTGLRMIRWGAGFLDAPEHFIRAALGD